MESPDGSGSICKNPKPERAYMEKAVLGLDLNLLERLLAAVMRRKYALSYTDVARIWVVYECKVRGSSAARAKAEDLSISKETRRHWFKGLPEWLDQMARRYLNTNGGEIQSFVASDVKAELPDITKIRDVDIEWIEQEFLREPVKDRAYRGFTYRLRESAAQTPGREHLQKISHATVWRYCRRLKRTVLSEGSVIPPRVKEKRKTPIKRAAVEKVKPAQALIKIVETKEDSNNPF